MHSNPWLHLHIIIGQIVIVFVHLVFIWSPKQIVANCHSKQVSGTSDDSISVPPFTPSEHLCRPGRCGDYQWLTGATISYTSDSRAGSSSKGEEWKTMPGEEIKGVRNMTRTCQSIALGYVSSLTLDMRRVWGGGANSQVSQTTRIAKFANNMFMHFSTVTLWHQVDQCDHAMSFIRVFSFGSSPSE